MKQCRYCNSAFEVAPEDLDFYDKISPILAGQKYAVPVPTLCPDCRQQRRLTWRNERSFYSRFCDLCKKPVISIYSPENPFPIYCNSCWWSDKWDPKKYGRDFDFNRPFFEQFYELRKAVPQLAIMNDDGVNSENCAYCQDYAFGKNCYLVSGSWYSENSFYSNDGTNYNRFVCDCMDLKNSELVYESMNSSQLYNCAFLQTCENCSDCFFGYDLKGCKNCFGCIGFRQKEYCVFNQPYSPEEYRQRVAAYQLNSYIALQRIRNEYTQWSLQFPRKYANFRNCENSLGDNQYNCRNTVAFDIADADHCKFYFQGDKALNCYDITTSGRNQLCYEGDTVDDSYLTLFCLWCWKSKNMLYNDNCHSSNHLLGCISMHRVEYSILNKSYGKEDYEKLAARVVVHMQKTGEWGEFFPSELAPYGYNETVAQEYYPLSKEAVLARGWKWNDQDPREYLQQKYEIPDRIEEVSDSIVNEILACLLCRGNFKIISQELSLYRKMGLPVPRICSNCRHVARLARRTAYKLWQRACARCQKEIFTAYATDRPETVLCEDCYLAVVY